MAELLTARAGREVTYTEVEPPPVPDMQGLWAFLREGGFDICTDTVQRVTGREAISFEEFLKGLAFGQASVDTT